MVKQYTAELSRWIANKNMGWDAIPHFLRKLSPWLAGEYMATEATLQDSQSPFYSANAKGTYLALIYMVDLPLLFIALLAAIWLLIASLKSTIHEMLPLAFYLLGSFMVLMVMEIAPRYTVSYRSLFCVLAIYGFHAFWKYWASKIMKQWTIII